MGTPRAGTSLLCELLARLGTAGVPEEYFWTDTKAELEACWDVADERDYLRRVAEAGTTGNGLFAAKVMWAYMDDAVRMTAGEHERPAGQHAALAAVLPDLRYVW